MRQIPNSIRVFARGGLGNQLFQYGAAYHLSHKLGLQVEVDDVLVSGHARFNSGLNKSYLELDSFENELIFTKNTSEIRAKVLSRSLGAMRLLGDRFPVTLLKLGSYSNEFEDQIETFNKINSPITINGYCSTPSYFPDCGKQIAENITKVLDPSDWYQNWIGKIEQTNPIGLNIRLGDYKNLQHIYGKLDPDYYKRSAEILVNLLGDRPLWIFSDEPELAKEMLGNEFENLSVVSHPAEKRPIEYLNLLAKCEGIVCANSSFSWWASYIATQLNPKSKIIFPRPMFDSKKFSEPFNWLPDNWLTVGRKVN